MTSDVVRCYFIMERDFYNEYYDSTSARTHPQIQKRHSILGSEEFDDWRWRSDDREGAVHPRKAEFGIKVRIVPPSSIQGVIDQLRDSMPPF